MKIATWNINGVKARLDGAARPGCGGGAGRRRACRRSSARRRVPRLEPFEALGYNVATHGQKGFNGVAILSRLPLRRDRPPRPARRRRRRAGALHRGAWAPAARCASAASTCPTATPLGTDKFAYKLAWMKRLETRAARAARARGDRSSCSATTTSSPSRSTARNPAAWTGDALYQPETRAAFRALLNLGFTDALRAADPSPASTPSGTIRPAPGRRTTASASTSSWLAAGRRPPRVGRHRQAHARLGEAVRPRAGVGGLAGVGGSGDGLAVLSRPMSLRSARSRHACFSTTPSTTNSAPGRSPTSPTEAPTSARSPRWRGPQAAAMTAPTTPRGWRRATGCRGRRRPRWPRDTGRAHASCSCAPAASMPRPITPSTASRWTRGSWRPSASRWRRSTRAWRYRPPP